MRGYMDPGDQVAVHPSHRAPPEQPSLFDAPPQPPTGPAADPHPKNDGGVEAFRAFLATPEGAVFWSSARGAARAARRAGERRWSARTYLAWFRDVHHIRMNDHWSPYLADMLVQNDPDLLDIIERRRRGSA